MNIAIFNTFSHTKSTGKIAYGLYSHLKLKGHNVFLYYGNPEEEKIDDNHVSLVGNTISFKEHLFFTRILGNQGEYSIVPTLNVIRKLMAENIQLVYLFNIHGNYLNYPLLFKYFSKKGVKVVYTMLDEYAFLGKCCFPYDCDKYQSMCRNCPAVKDYPKSLLLDRSKHIMKLKEKCYNSVPDITFVGIEYSVERAKKSRLLKNKKLCVLDESVNLKTLYYPRSRSELKKRLNIQDNKIIILTVAPFSAERKGCKYYLEAARRIKDERYIFLQVGFDVDKSICPENFIPIGYVQNQDELAEYYSLADVFVCTSLAETVPNSCIEALGCGTPLITFDSSGLPYIADDKHRKLVKTGDVDELVTAILEAKKKDDDMIESCRNYAKSRYDADEYFEKLERIGLGL